LRYLITALLALSLAAPSPVGATTGFAARYRIGLMEKVAVKRGIAPVGCLVASPFERIGTRLRITSLVNERQRTCTVVDVAHPRDRARIIERGIVVELSHQDARTLCGSVVDPPRQCRVVVKRIAGVVQ